MVLTKLQRKNIQFKKEPEWLLDWRLRAFKVWKNMKQPNWSELDLDPTDYSKYILLFKKKNPFPKLKNSIG